MEMVLLSMLFEYLFLSFSFVDASLQRSHEITVTGRLTMANYERWKM